MPSVDESTQERTPYDVNAPGWSARRGQTAATGTPGEPPRNAAPEEPGAPGESPTPGADAVPPTAPAPQDAGAPPEEGTPPSTPPAPVEGGFNEPPKERWDRIVQDKNDAVRQRDDAIRLAQSAVDRGAPQPAPAPMADPWAGKVDHPDPATAQFWQSQRQLMQHERNLGKQDAVRELQPTIQAGIAKIAQIDTRDFRRENPEIKPGSEDEQMIVAYMEGRMDGNTHTIDSAKRNTLFNRLEAENRAYKGKQAAVPTKRAANATDTSSGIPATAGLPLAPGNWRQVAGDIIDKGGGVIEAASAIFGGKRR